MDSVSTYDAEGMAWWNNMPERWRRDALDAARRAGFSDPSPADAWLVYRGAGRVKTETD